MEAKKLTQSKNKTKHTQPHALHTETGNTNRNANPEKKKKQINTNMTHRRKVFQ